MWANTTNRFSSIPQVFVALLPYIFRSYFRVASCRVVPYTYSRYSGNPSYPVSEFINCVTQYTWLDCSFLILWTINAVEDAEDVVPSGEPFHSSWSLRSRNMRNKLSYPLQMSKLFRISFQQFLNSDIGLSVAVWIDRSFSRSWSLARSRLTRRKEHKRWRERQRATCYKASLKRKQLDIRKPDFALLLRVNNPTRALLAPNLRSFPQAFHIHSAFTRIHRAS